MKYANCARIIKLFCINKPWSVMLMGLWGEHDKAFTRISSHEKHSMVPVLALHKTSIWGTHFKYLIGIFSWWRRWPSRLTMSRFHEAKRLEIFRWPVLFVVNILSRSITIAPPIKSNFLPFPSFASLHQINVLMVESESSVKVMPGGERSGLLNYGWTFFVNSL